MQFITALFGESAGTFLNAAFSLGLVLALIVFGLWALKLFTRAGENISRTRKRLVVVDSAVVDGKRKVLIIRRDDVEHVIMTGGPQDLVIETGIAVAPAEMPQPRAARQPPPAAGPADIATPITPERRVSREAVDRLHDLSRPAPLTPRASLRHTNLLRPVPRHETDIIPIASALRADNTGDARSDSANTGSGDEASGQTVLGGRNRFFSGVARDQM